MAISGSVMHYRSLVYYRRLVSNSCLSSSQRLIWADAHRIIEARLAGPAHYRPFLAGRTVPRPSDTTDYYRAAAEIREEAYQRPTPGSRRALALLNIVQGKIDDAVSELEAAHERWPQEAAVLNDLAAAYLARARWHDEPHDLIRALTAVQRARALDDKLIEARFNYALALEAVCLLPAARQQWQQYHDAETDADWRAEARAHIAQIERPSLDWPALRAQLDAAALRGDSTIVRDIVARAAHPARLYALDELLPNWADATITGNEAAAAQALTIATQIGSVLAQIEQGRLVIDLTSPIEAAARHRARITALAHAHRDYRDSRYLLDFKNESDKAERLMTQARVSFIAGGDEAGALLASFHLSRCFSYKREIKRAYRVISEVQAVAEARDYPYLAGRAGIIFARIYSAQVKFTDALASISKAERTLAEIGNLEDLAVSQLVKGRLFSLIGKSDEVYRYHLEASRNTRDAGDQVKRILPLLSTSVELAKMGELEASLIFYDEALKASLAAGYNAGIITVYRWRSLANYRLGRRADALADIDKAKSYLAGITDSAFRRVAEEQVLIAESDYRLKEQPRAAINSYTKVLNSNPGEDESGILTYLYMMRARAYMAVGRDAEAEIDMERGIKGLERLRNNLVKEDYRTAVFEESQSLFDDMIRLQAEQRKRIDRAFNYAETARARTLLDQFDGRDKIVRSDSNTEFVIKGYSQPLTLAAIERELPANVTLVSYSVQAEHLYSWIVQRNSTRLVKSAGSAMALEELANKLQSAIESGADYNEVARLSAPIYDLAVRPWAEHVPAGSTLIIVPDKALYRVPFAALYDSACGRVAVERWAIAVAPSASIYMRCLRRDRELARRDEGGALVVGNPKFTLAHFPGLAYLPLAEQEANGIAALYGSMKLLVNEQATKANFLAAAGNYGVIHFAGHSIMDYHAPLYSHLIFAPGARSQGADRGELFAYELSGQNFSRTRLVVLAACRTASGRRIAGEGPASFARPFLAAGVPAVIASLWDADDRASSEIFLGFHRLRIAGVDSINALRQAQLSLLNGSDPSLRAPKKWATYILLGGITTETQR